MNLRRLLVVGAALGFFALTAAAGAFTPISNPDAAYLGSTAYIDFSGIPLYTNVTSISDGILTVSFSVDGQPQGMGTRYAPGGGWATWSQAPDSQRPNGGTLPVLYSNGATSVLMTLSSGAMVFGFEAEPNPFFTHAMTATFYDDGWNLLGSITRDVSGNAGARLFAASDDPIWFVDFSSDVDWAAGAFRYSQVPEPVTCGLLGAGLLGLALLRRKLA